MNELRTKEYAQSLATQTELMANMNELQEHLDLVSALPDRTRIFRIRLDPVGLTAQLRSIEPSFRVEWSASRMEMIGYSDIKLPASKVNAIMEKVKPQVDLT